MEEIVLIGLGVVVLIAFTAFLLAATASMIVSIIDDIDRYRQRRNNTRGDDHETR